MRQLRTTSETPDQGPLTGIRHRELHQHVGPGFGKTFRSACLSVLKLQRAVSRDCDRLAGFQIDSSVGPF